MTKPFDLGRDDRELRRALRDTRPLMAAIAADVPFTMQAAFLDEGRPGVRFCPGSLGA